MRNENETYGLPRSVRPGVAAVLFTHTKHCTYTTYLREIIRCKFELKKTEDKDLSLTTDRRDVNVSDDVKG